MAETVVLTGGGGILGRAIVKELTESGYHIVVVDIDPDLAHTASEMAHDNGAATPMACDITNRSALEDLRAEVTGQIGPVKALLCNAATKSDNFFEPFETFPLEDWNQVMAVNLTAPMLCAQVFAPEMSTRANTSIVNTLSIYGIVAPDQSIYEGALYEGRAINTPAIYSASKAGLWGLTKYLASYYGGTGLRVNAVTPGGIYSGQNDEFQANYGRRNMLGRMAKSEEVASAFGYLISDKAGYITGHNLAVDGGWTAW